MNRPLSDEKNHIYIYLKIFRGAENRIIIWRTKDYEGRSADAKNTYTDTACMRLEVLEKLYVHQEPVDGSKIFDIII